MATAVLDVGKTNVKVAVYGADGDLLDERSRPNRSRPGPPYLDVDTAAIWSFLIGALAEFAPKLPIDTIVTTTHGAAGAFLGPDPDVDEGLALPILDYLDDAVDAIERTYAPLRPPFATTFSPPLGGGLNLGRQIAWQRERFPERVAAAAAFVAYPQYWTWRLSGRAVSETTSLGCHTDLWEPRTGRFSPLVDALGIRALLPPVARAADVVGTLRPAVARVTGLDPRTRVLAGIHDSNASLVPHLLARTAPFTIVSTGTWVVVMAVGAPLDGLDPAADMLANVAATGEPIACAKFMGGAEMRAITGDEVAPADRSDVEAVIAAGAFALPAFVPAGGPFAGRAGGILGPLPDRPGARLALATLYAALVTDHLVRRLEAEGPVIVEGGFLKAPLYAELLAALDPARPVFAATGHSGTARGAALLARWPEPIATDAVPIAATTIAGLGPYAREWARLVAG